MRAPRKLTLGLLLGGPGEVAEEERLHLKAKVDPLEELRRGRYAKTACGKTEGASRVLPLSVFAEQLARLVCEDCRDEYAARADELPEADR